MSSLAEKKVIGIGTVSKLSGLSFRQIRYYEERKLIFPERTAGGTRLYSFRDIEKLVDISSRLEEGLQTHDIRRLEKRSTGFLKSRPGFCMLPVASFSLVDWCWQLGGRLL